MTANAAPIYTLTPDVATDNSTTMATTLTTATGDYTGVSANHVQVHLAGTNGSYIRKLRFKATGSNVASVARIFINNGSTHTSAGNNEFFGEISLPATTAVNNASTPDVDYSMELPLRSGHSILVGLGTTVAAGWVCVAVAGQY